MSELSKVVMVISIAALLGFTFETFARNQPLPEFTPPPVPVDPLEVKLVGVDECAPGWEIVSIDEGYTIYYPHPAGYAIPNWVTETQVEAAFTGPDGHIIDEAMDFAISRLQYSERIICRWSPLRVLAASIGQPDGSGAELTGDFPK